MSLTNLAEHATVERLVNSYLRETGIFDPRTNPPQGDFTIILPNTNQKLSGVFTYWSQSGHHSYSPHFFNGNEVILSTPLTPSQIIEYIIDEISYLEPNETTRLEKRNHLLLQIQNSIEKTILYLQNYRECEQTGSGYLHSEQSMYFGHPFHPTPKSSEGFLECDLQNYSPEMGASFQLHYFAASPNLISEEWIREESSQLEKTIRGELQELANQHLSEELSTYSLLPTHPWQARYLNSLDHVKKLRKKGELLYLGPLGPEVYPTSSVRTVWSPDYQAYFKLPLHVRITNFIRENSVEQVNRTLDASRIIASLPEQTDPHRFEILREYGYRSIMDPSLPENEKTDLFSSFAVLFRDTPTGSHDKQSPLFVVGSLMEVLPGETLPQLFLVLQQQGLAILPDLRVWLQQYLKICLHPLFLLFIEHGISLEAHAQNSVVQLENGYPVTLFVRDLEGMSVDDKTARMRGIIPSSLPVDSPVLYSEEEAWHRFQYYVIVNHISYLIRTLAAFGREEESDLWAVVRTDLLNLGTLTQSDRAQTYIQKLLHDTSLPAKANLISRFQQRGETPLYVEIPNPISIHQKSEVCK